MIRKSIGVVVVLLSLVGMSNAGIDLAIFYSTPLYKSSWIQSSTAWMLAMVIGLGSISLYLKLQYNASIGAIIKFLAMPFGFYVSVQQLINIAPGGEAEMGVGLAPALVGGFLSALFFDAKSNDVMVPRWSRKVDLIIIPFLLFALVFLIASGDPLWVYGNFFDHAWLFVLGLPIAIFCFADITRRLDERLLDASLFGVLVLIAFLVLLYLTETMEWVLVGDKKSAVYEVAFFLTLITFGVGLYVCALLYSITTGNTHRIVRSNWHLAEGFVFIIFILFAPKSLFF